MDELDKFEESMKVLDILGGFISDESEYYIESDEIRVPLEEAFRKIYAIYQKYGNETIEEELRDRWEEINKNEH